MPRSVATSVENNFSRGLITEATAMNYPENSVVETENSIFLRDGTTLRRNGIDFEDGYETYTFEELDVFSGPIAADPFYNPPYDNVAISEFEWVSLSQGVSTAFLVVQIGDTLRFFEVDDNNKTSMNLKSFSIDIGILKTAPILETDLASVVGNVVVNNALIGGLTGTLTINKTGVGTETITFGVGNVTTRTLFEAALQQAALNLNIIAEINGSNFLHISALENDLLTSFTIGGSINALTAFGIDEKLYEPYTETAIEAVARRKCSFSTGLGYLFVVHPFVEPFFVEYSASTNGITVSKINVQTRDFVRLPDPSNVDERPLVLTFNHKYNLHNQGWYATDIKSVDNTNVWTLGYWFGKKGVYPSDSDVWWLWKNSEDKFDPLFNTFPTLSAPAPNGHYIYSAFQTNRRNATDVVLAGIEETSSGPWRPSVTSFFSSRVWYSGVTSDNYSSRIYFSKVIEDKADFGKCYQASDPTSETFSDLLEIDGGVIVIPDADRITALIPIGRVLLAFATNGVWAISGGNGGFKANDYSVQKLSKASAEGPSAIVLAESTPFWWSRNGIYTIISDPNSGELTVENISESTIKEHLKEVPTANIPDIKGTYNSVDKTVQWLYRTLSTTNDISRFHYNKILVLDTQAKSFYPLTVNPSSCFISGLTSSSKAQYDTLTSEKSSSTNSYLITGNFGPDSQPSFTIGQFKDKTFRDWFSLDGVGSDAAAYFVTGYRVRAELLRKFQSNYVVIMSKIVDNPGCLVQGIWNYDTVTDGKATTSQQVYIISPNKDYSRRKLKIRGNGYSLQFKFRSQPLKAFQLVGWAVSESAGNVP